MCTVHVRVFTKTFEEIRGWHSNEERRNFENKASQAKTKDRKGRPKRCGLYDQIVLEEAIFIGVRALFLLFLPTRTPIT